MCSSDLEVLSPTSIQRDREVKFKKYEQCGVKEYWIVDPLNKSLEQFVLEDRKYKLYGVYTKLDEEDRERLAESERNNLVTEFTTSVFRDLSVNIDEVF